MTFSIAKMWHECQNSHIFKFLRNVDALRSAVNLIKHIPLVLLEPLLCRASLTDQQFLKQKDPWSYQTSPSERRRFDLQTELLDSVRDQMQFNSGLEIGCAEGLYTETLAERCASLLVLDISATALSRAQSRRSWSNNIQFRKYDLRVDDIPGTFDLIVVTGVLEYFGRRHTLVRVRNNLVKALNPHGYLLIETTRANSAAENSWWAKYFNHGKWRNCFISRHPALFLVRQVLLDEYIISLFRKEQLQLAGNRVSRGSLMS